MHKALELANYRTLVGNLYTRIREKADAGEAWELFRLERDHLFKHHPQSALTPLDQAQFGGLEYFPYNPAYYVEAVLEPLKGSETLEVQLAEDGLLRMQRLGRLYFSLENKELTLTLFGLLGYGDGLFLPFGDLSNGKSTYGGGRYLLDSIKGAYLGENGGRLILDFNFAYNPSCAYNPHWVCPLAPPENRLELEVLAGEKGFTSKG